LVGGVSASQHISKVGNASLDVFLNIRTPEWDLVLLQIFGIRVSVLPRLVSTSEVYGYLAYGPLKGVPLGGLVGDQQGVLIGDKCLTQGKAKCTYDTGAFLLFCMGTNIVYSNHGLLSMVRKSERSVDTGIDNASRVAYQVGSQGKTVCLGTSQ
jgi:glycerol kinase